ncbi:MAG: iron chelate uptake ABC transporter family permease subunit, partial [Calditrichae bacterium]|nr:iron chelate uptake ABC transporter family permease subunit [Calditrichia bacterium]
MKKPFGFYLVSIIIFGLLTILVTPLIGPTKISFESLWSGGLEQDILLNLRLPRIIFAFLVGFILSMIGTVFQALLRNELATPYTLGVSSGGALGAVIAIKSGLAITFLGFSTTVLFSIAGSMITILVIYLIAKGKAGLSPVTLILTGVTLSLLFSSVILFIHYLADFTETYRMIRWLMGGLQISGWQYSLVLIPFTLLAFIYFVRSASAINIMSAGTELALSKGVNVNRLQMRAFFGGSFLIGIVVAFAGPIGFVGLIIPHLLRLLVGPDHRRLLVAAPLFGGIFLMWCDTLARTIISPAE